jgi:Tfp pilus assembly protein PilO
MSGRVRLTIVVGVLVLALAAVLSWLLVLSPRLSEADRLDQQAVDLETANLGLLNTFNRSLELAQQAPQSAAQAQELFAAMPQQADLAGVLEQVTQAAVDAGIPAGAVETINTTIPTPLVTEEDADTGVALAQLQIAITAKGTQRQALAFLDNLQRLDRVMLVTSSRLIEEPVQGEREQWAMQVTGSMFVLQSELPDLVQDVQDLLDDARLERLLNTQRSTP